MLPIKWLDTLALQSFFRGSLGHKLFSYPSISSPWESTLVVGDACDFDLMAWWRFPHQKWLTTSTAQRGAGRLKDTFSKTFQRWTTLVHQYSGWNAIIITDSTFITSSGPFYRLALSLVKINDYVWTSVDTIEALLHDQFWQDEHAILISGFNLAEQVGNIRR